jgi:hypothetical protein
VILAGALTARTRTVWCGSVCGTGTQTRTRFALEGISFTVNCR